MQIESIECQERTKIGIKLTGFRIMDEDGDIWYFLPSTKLSTMVMVLDHKQAHDLFEITDTQMLKKVRTVALEPDI